MNTEQEDMAAYNTFLMGENILIIVCQILSATGNGFISYLFVKLRKINGLQMLWVLSITDLLFAISVFPYMLYYVIGWTPTVLNYDGFMVIKLSFPLTMQYKITLVIGLAIASDRIQALFFSVHYRQRNNHYSYIVCTLLTGVIWGTFDCILEIFWNPVQSNPGCAAVGCFNGSEYRRYWGNSNMLLSVIMLVLTLVLGIKLKTVNQKSSKSVLAHSKQDSQRQANRLTMAIILISVCFHAIPSSLVGVADYFGINVFSKLGPFYILGLVLGGVCNSIAYITLHKELKNAALKAILPQKLQPTTTIAISKSTTRAAGHSSVLNTIK
ncbi:unnamed protein product [Bursaphelenchus okinawaensis]|uniref:G_PROTEIN_RECEP_F1_2 domain-containing protein n=1 Tax=Bursaphelenchus okinawaensis TaxID=465554 RepID=A0A811L8K2_9BILA|nr:unnamed protein product [Bursaphelenchus okinawaensis]CAG9117971.1 unnamed protein product [Bursaphelenchus okinawaensis]